MIYLLTGCAVPCLNIRPKQCAAIPRRQQSPREDKEETMRQPFGLLAVSAFALAMSAHASCAADKPIVGLITKTNTNPFFVKMKAGAEEAAKATDVELRSFAGKVDGDNDSQAAASE